MCRAIVKDSWTSVKSPRTPAAPPSFLGGGSVRGGSLAGPLHAPGDDLRLATRRLDLRLGALGEGDRLDGDARRARRPSTLRGRCSGRSPLMTPALLSDSMVTSLPASSLELASASAMVSTLTTTYLSLPAPIPPAMPLSLGETPVRWPPDHPRNRGECRDRCAPSARACRSRRYRPGRRRSHGPCASFWRALEGGEVVQAETPRRRRRRTPRGRADLRVAARGAARRTGAPTKPLARDAERETRFCGREETREWRWGQRWGQRGAREGAGERGSLRAEGFRITCPGVARRTDAGEGWPAAGRRARGPARASGPRDITTTRSETGRGSVAGRGGLGAPPPSRAMGVGKGEDLNPFPQRTAVAPNRREARGGERARRHTHLRNGGGSADGRHHDGRHYVSGV